MDEDMKVNMILVEVVHSTAKIMFIRSSEYESFHIFQFMSYPPLGILRTHNGLLSSWFD